MPREGFSVYGIVGSKHAINLAKERLEQEYPGWLVELIVGDIGKPTFDDF
jgi:hypothetical protein